MTGILVRNDACPQCLQLRASESRLRAGLRELAERVNLLLEWMPMCSVGSSGHSRRIAVEESLRALLENRIM